MYVIREMEDAIDDCLAGDQLRNDGSVHAWDEAVAFYSGSLETGGGTGDGYLIDQLADKRCENFKTCGEKGDATSGRSKVNIEIFKLFNQGKNEILGRDCEAARETKAEIVQLMTVPLIQGTLRYAYITGSDSFTIGRDTSAQAKALAEGATFAAAVVPFVAFCDEEDGDYIYSQMTTMGQGGYPDFDEVKDAFERRYKCLGITCKDVGGVVNALGEYEDGASPCTSGAFSGNAGWVLSLGLSAVGLVVTMFM